MLALRRLPQVVSLVRIIYTASAQQRLDEASRFVDRFPPATEVLIVGASREAIDEFVRGIVLARGATFGLHRFSLTQLPSRVASTVMARRHLVPATHLGIEAVAARATFEALTAADLHYVTPVARLGGFGPTLAATLDDLRLAGVEIGAVDPVRPPSARSPGAGSGFCRPVGPGQNHRSSIRAFIRSSVDFHEQNVLNRMKKAFHKRAD